MQYPELGQNRLEGIRSCVLEHGVARGVPAVDSYSDESRRTAFKRHALECGINLYRYSHRLTYAGKAGMLCW